MAGKAKLTGAARALLLVASRFGGIWTVRSARGVGISASYLRALELAGVEACRG